MSLASPASIHARAQPSERTRAPACRMPTKRSRESGPQTKSLQKKKKKEGTDVPRRDTNPGKTEHHTLFSSDISFRSFLFSFRHGWNSEHGAQYSRDATETAAFNFKTNTRP